MFLANKKNQSRFELVSYFRNGKRFVGLRNGLFEEISEENCDVVELSTFQEFMNV